jgi:hypothetical protein
MSYSDNEYHPLPIYPKPQQGVSTAEDDAVLVLVKPVESVPYLRNG